jgi:hypothetical protein
VIAYAGAVLATRVAEVLLTLLLQALLELATFDSLAFGFPGSDIPALVVVDVPSDFKIEISLAGCRCDTFGARVRLSWRNCAVWSWLMGLQATWSVCCDPEMPSERWADI